MVLLRDGRTLIGYLRSIDQFGKPSLPCAGVDLTFHLILCRHFTAANLVLHRTIERIHVGDRYGDIPRGIFLIRGENVVLCGEVSESERALDLLTKVDVEEILELQHKELISKQEKEKLKMKAMQETGLTLNLEGLQDEF